MQPHYQRVLVTGGAGFIGHHVVRALLDAGCEVTVLDDLSTGLLDNVPAEADFVQGSILDPRALAQGLNHADAVVHMAAKVTVRGSMDRAVDDARTNLMGTVALLSNLSHSSVRHVVFASSMAVYEEAFDADMLTETQMPFPQSPYGVTKLAAEHEVRILCNRMGIAWHCLRLFNTYGPGQRLSPYVGVITIFADAIRNRGQVSIFGDGMQTRDYLHVEDAAAAFLHSLANPESSGIVCNVGTGTGTSIMALVDMLQDILDYVPARRFEPARPEELIHAVADTALARDALGFEARIPLMEGLRSTLTP